MFNEGDFFPFLAFIAGTMAVPYLALVASSFIKIAVVIMILRNAIGIQQTPPNIVVYTIALALTLFIMQPVATQAFENMMSLGLDYSQIEDFARTVSVVSEPIEGFLERNTRPVDVAFFTEVRKTLVADIDPNLITPVEGRGLTLMVPSFMLSELTRAFEMGFMLYLPFLAVDMVLTAVLMAMGMNMVSPTVVAVPFKLLLFVALDGWPKLIQGLVLSYA